MFLKSHFVFYDFSEPVICFLIDYLAVMELFVGDLAGNLIEVESMIGFCMILKMWGVGRLQALIQILRNRNYFLINIDKTAAKGFDVNSVFCKSLKLFGIYMFLGYLSTLIPYLSLHSLRILLIDLSSI